jgi:AcrR family transcriptional regulator
MASTAAAGARVPTRKARAEETRRKLIVTAIEKFSERHYDEVAVSDIAEAAGVAHGLLFHYFHSKRGIYLEAMRAAARDLNSAREVEQGIPPGGQVRQMFEAHFRYLAQHQGLALRLVLGGRGADPEAWELFEEDRWQSIDWVCNLIGLDPQRPALRLMLRATVGCVDEATANWLESGQQFEIELMAEALVDLTVAGLRGAARLDESLDVEKAIALLQQR